MFQTRSEENGLKMHDTFIDALIEGAKDKTVWKISFDTVTKELIRLVRTSEGWTYEAITGSRTGF